MVCYTCARPTDSTSVPKICNSCSTVPDPPISVTPPNLSVDNGIVYASHRNFELGETVLLSRHTNYFVATAVLKTIQITKRILAFDDSGTITKLNEDVLVKVTDPEGQEIQLLEIYSASLQERILVREVDVVKIINLK